MNKKDIDLIAFCKGEEDGWRELTPKRMETEKEQESYNEGYRKGIEKFFKDEFKRERV